MSGPLVDLGQDGELLILVAAPGESRAVCAAFDAPAPDDDWVAVPLGLGVELVQTGVGKVNAALAAAKFVQAHRHRAVLNTGVCGALPRLDSGPSLTLTQTVVGDFSVYADEGIATPGGGWQDIAAAGFPPGGAGARAFEGMAVAADAQLVRFATAKLGDKAKVGRIATVSTCSGTDALAAEVARRTGAIGEGMEGAAVGHAVARLFGRSVGFLELRVVSNTTGDRTKQVWDLKGAFAELTEVMRLLSRR